MIYSVTMKGAGAGDSEVMLAVDTERGEAAVVLYIEQAVHRVRMSPDALATMLGQCTAVGFNRAIEDARKSAWGKYREEDERPPLVVSGSEGVEYKLCELGQAGGVK